MSARLGLIGAGVMGRLRAQALLRVPALELRAIADADETRLRAMPGTPDILRSTDYSRMLERGEIDAIVISTPTHLHEEMVLAALDAGKHVLCEKPLANSVASCRKLVDRAAAAGKVLAVGFNHRYFRSVRYLKNAIDSGTIGDLDHLRVFGGHEGLGQLRGEWMYQSAHSGGGAMMDIGIHLTDLVRYVAGEIVEVYGTATNRIWKIDGSEDNALAIFKSKSGAIAHYQATWDEWKGYRFAIEAYGTRGMVQARYAPMFNLLITHDGRGNNRARSARFYPFVNIREKVLGWERNAVDALAEELYDFARQLGGHPGAGAQGIDGLRAVEIAHAVYESSRRGCAIRIGA